MRRTFMVTAQGVAIAALVATTATACGSSGSKSSGSASSTTAAAPTATTPTSTAATAKSTAASGTPFKVLAIVAASGPLAPINAAEMQGLEAGAAVVNKEGGVDGHPIQVKVENDNLDPTTAANLLESAVSSGSKPNLVFAGTTSDETLALVPILTQNKLLSMQLAVSNQTIDPAKFPSAFTLGPDTTEAAAGLVSSLKGAYPNAKSVGILIGNDVNGTSLLGDDKTALRAAGIKVYVQQYDPTSTIDMTPQLEALKADNPDVLIASGFGQVAGYILAGRAKIGWTVPIVGDNSFSANNLVSLGTPADLKGVSISANKTLIYAPLAQRSPAFQTFYKAVQAQGGNFSQPIAIYSLGYDISILVGLAGDQVHAIDTVSMTKALETLNQPSPVPYVSYTTEKFSATQHSPILDPADTVQASPYSKDGQSLPFGQTP